MKAEESKKFLVAGTIAMFGGCGGSVAGCFASDGATFVGAAVLVLLGIVAFWIGREFRPQGTR